MALHIEDETEWRFFEYVFTTENCFIQVTLKFVPKGPIDKLSLVRVIRAWHRATIRTNDDTDHERTHT